MAFEIPNFPTITNIESIFEFLKSLLMTISGWIRELVSQFIPQYESLAIIGISLGIGYYIGRKINIPIWVIISIALFLWFRYI